MALKITHKDNSNIECTSDLSFAFLYLGYSANFPPRNNFFLVNFYFFTKEDNATPLQDRITDISVMENIKFDIAPEDWATLNLIEINNRIIAKFLELNPTYNLVVV